MGKELNRDREVRDLWSVTVPRGVSSPRDIAGS